jgi:fluoride exporter
VSLGTWVALTLAGGCGAVARAALTHAITVRAGRGFPYGTLAINLSGAFALGALSAAGVSAAVLSIAGTGFLGAYTTFSTWMFETDHAARRAGQVARAVVNVVGSVALGLLAVWLGRSLF